MGTEAITKRHLFTVEEMEKMQTLIDQGLYDQIIAEVEVNSPEKEEQLQALLNSLPRDSVKFVSHKQGEWESKLAKSDKIIDSPALEKEIQADLDEEKEEFETWVKKTVKKTDTETLMGLSEETPKKKPGRPKKVVSQV